MRTSINAVLAGLAMLTAGFTASAAAAGEFTVVNDNDSLSIQQVWTAGSGMPNDTWNSADLNSPVRPGTSRAFTTDGNVCFYDVRVQFSDGYRQTFDNVNVCRGDRVIGS